MTLVDLITLGLIRTDAQAERFAEQLVDCWHRDLVPGELPDVLGLTHREYQAWTTGGVSLLTIARWHQTSHPALDASKPWFKLSGRPGHEIVGHLEDRETSRNRASNGNGSRPRKGRRIVS
jgi:hypothetical protein